MRTVITALAIAASLMGCDPRATRTPDYCAELHDSFVDTAEAQGAGSGQAENSYYCPWSTPPSEASFDACLEMLGRTTTVPELRAALASCE